MSEMLDVYDANRRHLGVADRNVVHACGLWHKTVHCWIVWKGMLVFQRRSRRLDSNPGRLYTTASGHVQAGESLETAFRREVAQEIGLTMDNEKLMPAQNLRGDVYVCDVVKTDGKILYDRVFFTSYWAKYMGELSDFIFSDGEVDSVVAIDLTTLIAWMPATKGTIPALEFDGKKVKEIQIGGDDFTLNAGEEVYKKYGPSAEMILKQF
jgi:isopentenyldiphosphate isomerase